MMANIFSKVEMKEFFIADLTKKGVLKTLQLRCINEEKEFVDHHNRWHDSHAV